MSFPNIDLDTIIHQTALTSIRKDNSSIVPHQNNTMFSWSIGVMLLMVAHLEFNRSTALPARDNNQLLVVNENKNVSVEMEKDYENDSEYGELGPTPAFLTELQKKLDEMEKKKQDQNLIRVARNGDHNVIYHGNTIGLQLPCRANWFGCVGSPCGDASCPGFYFENNDWNTCYGEVFEIYRFSGPGEISVGDPVGIHYPRQSGHWVGCAGSHCGKTTCPGHPTTANGFSNRENWFRCWGEVFVIYSRNKGVGTVINNGDDVTLFYINGNQWLSHAGGTAHKAPCPGTVRPQSADKYETCWGETFTISKR